MAYGELKVDSITFTNGGIDTTVSVSGLVQNPTFSGDITVTGTISGDVILGGTTVSGATVTGTAGEFGTVTGNTAGFTTVTGTTVTGTTASFTSGVFTNINGGNVLVGTTTASGAAPVQIASATTLGTTLDTGGLSIVNNSSKTYPTSSGFSAFPGCYTEIELGTSQTIDETTPGGFNFISGDYRLFTKWAGNTSDIDRLYFIGFNQLFSWTDLNTCKQYIGISDTFSYSGCDENGRTSSYLIAANLRLFPPDTKTQTIANAEANSIFILPSGTSTCNITYLSAFTANLTITSFSAGTKTVNITNHTFLGTNSSWGTSATSGTINATITNLYGLRLTAPGLGTTGLTITNNWGIRQEWSSAKNWFAGASNQFPNITTTASGANAFLDSADSNRLYRSTSSITYKRDVEDLNSEYADQVLNLRPVWYRSKCESDCQDWSWYGLIAEEVAEIDPRFVHYGYQEEAYEFVETTETVELRHDDPRREEGVETEEITHQVRQLKADARQVPNGVAYERLVVPLLDIIKRQKSQLESIEARLAALEGA